MITGATLGIRPLTSQQILLQSFSNGNFPATVYSRSKRGGYQGSKIVMPTFGSYQFVSSFKIIGLSFSDLAIQRDAFFQTLGMIHSSGAQTLVLSRSDGTARQIEIKAVQVTGDIKAGDGTSSVVQVIFEAEYPFLLGTELKKQDVMIYNGGGMSVPMGVPLDLSHGKATTLSIANNGNYAAYPLFTFIGPLTNPLITNNTTGKTLNIAQTLASSADSVVVDTYLHTVILEPSGNIGRQYASGDFWTMPIGESDVTLGNDNTTDLGKCTITWRDTWLGV